MKSALLFFLTTVILAACITAGRLLHLPHFDEPPFIALNLLFSVQAAYTGPILLLASNRQAAKDRALAAKDDEELAELLTINRRLMAMQMEQTDAHRTEMTMLRQLLGKRKAAGE